MENDRSDPGDRLAEPKGPNEEVEPTHRLRHRRLALSARGGPDIAFTGKPGESGSFDYSGLAHAEYQQDGGRLEYVTYVRTVAPFESEMRLVQLDFGAAG